MTTVHSSGINNAETPDDSGAPVIEDAEANHELYQQFLRNEGSDSPDPDETSDTPVTNEDDGGTDTGSGEGGSVAPSASSPDADPDDTSVDDDEPVDQPLTFNYDGHDYTAQELDRVFKAAQWVGQINPTQADFIDRVLSGQIQVDPQTLLPVTPTPPVTQAPIDDDYEYADPRLKEELDTLRATVNSLQSTTQSQLAQTQAQTQAQILSEIEAGVAAYTAPFDLTDAERQALVESSVTAQIIPSLATSLSPRDAIQQAMDYAFWNTPDFRDRAIELRAQESAANVTQIATRKSKASALAGSGGTIPRNAPAAPMTPAQRRSAMAAEIAESVSGN